MNANAAARRIQEVFRRKLIFTNNQGAYKVSKSVITGQVADEEAQPFGRGSQYPPNRVLLVAVPDCPSDVMAPLQKNVRHMEA